MKPIIVCIILICLFSGCKKKFFDNLIFKNNFQCNIDGRECYSNDRNFGPYGTLIYTYNKESKKFNLKFSDYLINEQNSLNSYRLNLGLCTYSWPEIGKEYKITEYGDSIYRYVFEQDACWVSFTYVTHFYNYMDTTLLPKEIQKRQSTVKTKKINGYIVFDQIDLERSIFNGRFNFNFEGENSCYPETKVKLTVNNGRFELYFWDESGESEGTPYFTYVNPRWECYEFEEQNITK